MVEIKEQNKIQKIKRILQNHLADSTAMTALFTPLAASLETLLSRMPNEISADARLIGAGITYAGMGWVYSKGLHLSRKKFNIQDKDSEKTKNLHDTKYGVIYSLFINPIFYYALGVRDWKPILIGTIAGTVLSMFSSGPTGYFIDTFRDLVGLEDSVRTPRKIANLTSKSKKGLAALLVASSIGLTAGVYGLRTTIDNYLRGDPQEMQKVEQVEKIEVKK